jgi:drug/metabolite transporter (DMT)-like permease
MSAPNITKWIGIGLLGLPIYGALTFFSSLDPQPDPNTHYDAWARFVTTDYYVLKHLFATILGIILAIFGTFALGAYLAKSRAGRLGLVAMVITVFGIALFLTVGGVSTFASPEQGQMHLLGIDEYRDMPSILAETVMMATFGVSFLLMLVGNVLLGVAVWRSGMLPRWAGALWAAGSALPVLGMLYALLPIGADSSPPTVPAGAVLLVISGGWMAWSVLRGPTADTVSVGAQPRVQ